MSFTLSPFFYCIAHQEDITKFVTLSLGGEHICNVKKDKLNELVRQYIMANSHGVSYDNIDKYIECICRSIAPNL